LIKNNQVKLNTQYHEITDYKNLVSKLKSKLKTTVEMLKNHEESIYGSISKQR